MLVLIGVLLTLIPLIAILFPFIRRRDSTYAVEDEGSIYSELWRRWDAAMAGLSTTTLERAIGNLAEEDYRKLKEQYMMEAALVMKAMKLSTSSYDRGVDAERKSVSLQRRKYVN